MRRAFYVFGVIAVILLLIAVAAYTVRARRSRAPAASTTASASASMPGMTTATYRHRTLKPRLLLADRSPLILAASS
jgi:hypothetical protein